LRNDSIRYDKLSLKWTEKMTVYQLRLAHVTKNENIKEEAKTKKPMHTLHSKFGPSPDSVNL